MAAVDMLRAHAEEFTDITRMPTAVVEAGSQLFVVLKRVRPPAGVFALDTTDLLFITDRMYPLSAMDMFWTEVGLTRADGRIPQGATAIETYIDRQWRRFSWHRNGVWNPNRNGVLDHFAFVEAGWATRGAVVIRLIFTEGAFTRLTAHLEGSAPLEEGAFCLVHEGRGHLSRRLLVDTVLLPPDGAWEVQLEGALRPSAQWVSAAVSEAIRRHAGLLFVHSHPDPFHPLGFSHIDLAALRDLGRTLAPMLDGPFAGVVVHPEGWAGALWNDTDLTCIDRIWAIGRTVRWLTPLTAPLLADLDPAKARRSWHHPRSTPATGGGSRWLRRPRLTDRRAACSRWHPVRTAERCRLS